MRRLPVASNLFELDYAPRQFLFFCFFNVVSWQCLVSYVLVLFARSIDMPVRWVGFLQSFMPLSMVLAAFTVPLVTYLGPKRLMARTWLLRNLSACLVFLMPFAIARWGKEAGWYVLMAATLAFCLMRALGGGGWFAWLHEVVPENQRGAYFSAEALVCHCINIGVLLLQGLILAHNPPVSRFLLIYVIGIAAGLASLAWMYRVPGGHGIAEAHGPGEGWTAYRDALADTRFLKFVFTASLCFSILSWYGSAIILYMRDAMKITPNRILFITTASSVCILMTVRAWGRYAERHGSGPAMFQALLAHSLAILCCLTLIPGSRWGIWALAPMTVTASVFAAAFWVVTHRALLNHVQEQGRAAYTCIWTVVTALALGLTPIAVGYVVDIGGIWGFRACFFISGIGGLGAIWLCQRVVRDGEPVAESLWAFLHPAALVRTLGRILLITAGRHPGARQAAQSPASS